MVLSVRATELELAGFGPADSNVLTRDVQRVITAVGHQLDEMYIVADVTRTARRH